MSRHEIIWTVRIAALLICFALAFIGRGRFVVYLGFVGIMVFCVYAVYKVLSRSAARSAESAKLHRRAMDDLHKISEVLGFDE